MIALKAAAEQCLPDLQVRARKLAAMGRMSLEDAEAICLQINELHTVILATPETTDETQGREF